ncbi:MAG: bifunctional folylpolyglutamate synthase/dihydrofolate synthase, partial [Bacteroidales bacterium]|nr:bifunctional folylpolyglutamate synthase/dihydrofolate synthase [Bacteroidales bacterium]
LIGRWQVISNNPTIICDSGHNKDALQYVVPQLKQICKNKLHFVLGFSNDKNLDAILPLFPKEASYYFTKAAIERGLDESKLKEKALEYGISGNSYSSVKEALMAAKENASADDVIYVGGSMFVIAEVL